MAKVQIKHYGRVVNGKKEYYNFPLYKKQIESLEGKEFVEIIDEKHKKGTTDQFSYLYGAIYSTLINTEYFAHFNKEEDIHSDFFAPMFLGYSQRVITPESSRIINKVKSLTEISRKEFSEFIEKVIAWCDENEITVPNPEQYHSRYFKTIYKDGK